MSSTTSLNSPIEGFIPTMELRDPDKGSNATAPQTLASGLHDSRLVKWQSGSLTPQRIRELRKDPTISFLRETITSPAVHTPWTYKETKDAPAGAKELIESEMSEHRLWLLQNCFTGCIDFGWQPFEKVLNVNKDGFITVSNYKQLLQDYTDILIYVDTGAFAGLVNYPTGTTDIGSDVSLPLQNSFICNFEVEGTDWYGRSISEVIDSIQYKWTDVDSAATRFDKKIAGSHWVLYYPVGETRHNGVVKNNDVIAQEVLKTLEASGTTAIPDEVQEFMDDEIDKEMKGKWRLELLGDKGSTQQHFTDREKYLDNLKARAFGLPERSIFEGKFGTKAEADVHADIGVSNVDMKHRIIVQYINHFIVRQLMFLNYGPGTEKSVYIEVAPLVDSQFQMLKEVYRLLVQAPGLQDLEMPLIDTKALRQKLDIPSVPDADALQDRMRKEMEEDRQFQREDMRAQAEERTKNANEPAVKKEGSNGDK